MSDFVYLDYNATTPVELRVVDPTVPYFLKEYGNPSNTSHRYGCMADEATAVARTQYRLAREVHAPVAHGFLRAQPARSRFFLVQLDHDQQSRLKEILPGVDAIS